MNNDSKTTNGGTLRAIFSLRTLVLVVLAVSLAGNYYFYFVENANLKADAAYEENLDSRIKPAFENFHNILARYDETGTPYKVDFLGRTITIKQLDKKGYPTGISHRFMVGLENDVVTVALK